MNMSDLLPFSLILLLCSFFVHCLFPGFRFFMNPTEIKMIHLTNFILHLHLPVAADSKCMESYLKISCPVIHHISQLCNLTYHLNKLECIKLPREQNMNNYKSLSSWLSIKVGVNQEILKNRKVP